MTGQQSLLYAALGTKYIWGAGSLKDAPQASPAGFSTAHGFGFDCSGFVQWALYMLGIVAASQWVDLRAADLANACDPVSDVTQLVTGDLVFYGAGAVTHVMMYCGNGMVIGATGGKSTTLGDDPLACVQCRPLRYRNDVIVCGRLKPQFRKPKTATS